MQSSKRVILAWIPVVVMVGIIMLESFALSSNETGGILQPILDRLWIAFVGHGIGWQTFDFIHTAIRKTGHFVGYGLVCYFFFRAWRITFQHGETAPTRAAQWFWNRRWAALALIGTAVVASADEIHQAFDPSRTGTFHDVVLDCAGGAAALAIAWASANRKKRLELIAGRATESASEVQR